MVVSEKEVCHEKCRQNKLCGAFLEPPVATTARLCCVPRRRGEVLKPNTRDFFGRGLGVAEEVLLFLSNEQRWKDKDRTNNKSNQKDLALKMHSSKNLESHQTNLVPMQLM